MAVFGLDNLNNNHSHQLKLNSSDYVSPRGDCIEPNIDEIVNVSLLGGAPLRLTKQPNVGVLPHDKEYQADLNESREAGR